MSELISQYSAAEIITFIVALCLAIKGVISFNDWAFDRLKSVFSKEEKENRHKESVADEINQTKEQIKTLSEHQIKMEDRLDKMLDKINILVESDKDDIKSFITREHHYFCYQKGWIDDYSLNCIEKRYDHYKDEGGNSFIKELMHEIRALPKQPPQDK